MHPLIFLLVCGALLSPRARAEEPDAGAPESSDEEDLSGMQMDMSSYGPEGAKLPHARQGSGTSWMPDANPIYAHHWMLGQWMVMLHYAVSAGYDDQWSARGSRRFLSTNWVMGMASHPLLGGEVMFRSMLSGEPATAGGSGQVPLLLQSGETYGGVALHDRQHPHDLFMEVAAIYRHAIVDDIGVELYAAPSGEPALGPTAFMHRLSAMNDPFPPISHHWQDSTHISFPVLTAGLYRDWLKLEGSLFHGREPDEDRWNFDFGPLDSWSLRADINPIREIAAELSWGYLNRPEAQRPEQSEHRLIASIEWTQNLLGDKTLATTCAWGRKYEPNATTDSLLLETQLDLGNDIPFARVEWVQKLGDDLVIPGDPEAQYPVTQLVLGYARRLPRLGPVAPTIGIAIDLGFIPDNLQPYYGTGNPFGMFVFIGIHPPLLNLGSM